MHTYLDLPVGETQRRIAWNVDDPNLLQMGLPGGLQVRSLWVVGSVPAAMLGCRAVPPGRAHACTCNQLRCPP